MRFAACIMRSLSKSRESHNPRRFSSVAVQYTVVRVEPEQSFYPYRADRISPERLKILLMHCSFDDVLASVYREISDLTYKPDPGNREALGHWRAKFVFSVTEPTYDLFFNGSAGYRAQFCEDSMVGVLKNQQCVDVLRPLLLDFARTCVSVQDLRQIEASLRCRSAKVWIDESACTLDPSIVSDDVVAISVPRWVQAAREAELEIKTRQDSCPKAKKAALDGVQAPQGTRLAVFGGFIDEASHREFVVPSKRRRHQHIQLYGFS